MNLLNLLRLAVVLLACSSGTLAAPQREILWDTWGVPHIYAQTMDDAFYLLGWAQAHGHANNLAQSYGEAQGRAAEHWGAGYLREDLMTQSLDLPQRSVGWLKDESEECRSHLSAFARGINEYVAAHPGEVATENRWVFPIAPETVLAHNARLLAGFLFFDADAPAVESYIERLKAWKAAAAKRQSHGSNAYAIGPGRSASGHAMLVINPHLDWQGELMYFESHIVAPGVNAYGASLIGQAFHSVGFTPVLGWTHTVNPADGADTYELTLKDGGYLFDGRVLPFERAPDVVLRVRGEDGRLREQRLERRSSVHGPVILYDEQAGKALAVRFTGMDATLRTERSWSLVQAGNLAQFEAATLRYPLPFFNTVYADRDGNILYQYNAALPDRKVGTRETWRGIVPGDSSRYLWQSTLPITAMPRLLNPKSGFLQNSNDPPWSSTWPSELDPADYSPFLPAPRMDFRTQTITKALVAAPKLTFEALVAQKNSNRVEMADRFLPDLLAAAAGSGDAAIQGARKVLAAWDRHVNPGSRGAVLFLEWVEAMGGTGGDWFAERWSLAEPLATPRGLKSPQEAVTTLGRVAARMKAVHGSVDVAFGDVYRMRLGGKDVPSRVASVSYGMAPDGGFRRVEGGKHHLIGSGDTFVAVVEFGDPQRAEGLLPYGNSSQPGSPHVGDQLELFSQGKLRPLWRDRAEIERHLEHRETP